MGSYYMEDARFYSGYDEYAEPRNLGISSKLRKGRKSASRGFDRRAKFLTKRKSKRVLKPLEGDSDGVDDLQDKENEPNSPTHGLQRQVWLPTRNFAFRQRAGKLDTRAIARLDLEKIAATTDIETIQRHLENLAFADVTLDDVQHYSDAYFLKLFQIAQLMTECQQLETENGQHETEISSLKREIRQKQRTMATSAAKENAAREANVLVDELLNNHTDPTATEEGSITNQYLLRHQQRRHQDSKKQKKKKKSSSSSGSSNDSDSKTKKKKKTEKSAPLPREVLDALEDKNQLAKQLTALQDQVRFDQEARDRQRQQLENQQSQMGSRVEQYMEKLQTTLVEIEKKQEATKQDLRQYTQEAIARLQVEVANAEVLRLQAQKTSRAGRLENDDGEGSEVVRSRSEEARWSEKVEKLMDTFLKAQAQKQQEIDTLEQESNKLWTNGSALIMVEEAMTANDLRVSIAKVLSGKDEFEDESVATMTYHRVLLHHKQTGAELRGDIRVHELKNAIEVEIIPYHEVAAMQVGQVIETHAMVSGQIEDIKRKEARQGVSGDEDLRSLSSENYENHTSELGLEQTLLPADVQRRIQLLTERSTPMATARNSLLSSWLGMSRESRQAAGKSVGNFDPNEIDRLANAYEEGKSPVEVPRLDISEVKEPEPPTSGRNLENKEDKDEQQLSQPLELEDDEEFRKLVARLDQTQEFT
uniref:Cilium assembly protein DZIP1 N-terminal domain-containing protein n=1 Tax=Phytophthora ramorum TaxID=164328 RepID=H3HD19_PHYRM